MKGLPFLLLLVSCAAPGFSSSLAPQDPQPQPLDGAASGGKAGHGFWETRLGYYHNDDGGEGNPFLDEELTVIEPIFIYDYNVTDRLALWGQFSYDSVSSASIDRLSKFPDQSGASGDNYIGVSAGFRYEPELDFRYGGFLSFSSEYDYNSLGVGGDLAWDFDDKNATFKISANAFFDTIDIIRFDGTQNEGTDNRNTFSTTAAWYQVIDPNTHGELGLTLSFQSGFLETAYNAVVIEDSTLPPNPNLENMAKGTEIAEELPNSRVREALFGKVRRSLGPSTAIELGGRLYADSWGITSITVEPQLHQWLVDDVLSARLRYRFYTQTEADDFKEHFYAIEKFRTQDSDLGKFNSNTFGVRFDWRMSPTSALDFSFDLVDRSDGLSKMLGSIGYTKRF